MQCLAAIFLAVSVLSVSTDAGHASRPVHKTIIGCVVDGVLISRDGYRIQVRDSRKAMAVDLSRYEGWLISLTGNLLPGDNFYVTTGPRILRRCAKPDEPSSSALPGVSRSR